MAKIIVGVDFSEGSDMAVTIATNLAHRFGTSIQIVGVNETGMSEAELMAEIRRREEVNDELFKGLTVENTLRHGEITDVLCEEAAKSETTMIVVGTPDIAGLQKSLMGRLSYALLTKSPVPVLCVREDFKFSNDFKNILLPIDSSDESRQKVAKAVRLAKAFGSNLHVVGVNKSTTAEEHALVKTYIVQIKNYLDTNNIPNTLEQVNVDGTVSKTIIACANKYHVDLVLMMRECGLSLIKHLAGSADQKLLTEIKIPILTIQPKIINTIKVL